MNWYIMYKSCLLLILFLPLSQELVAEDEATANQAAEVAGAIKADCEADLAEALPALEAAIGALDTLKPSDISQVSVYLCSYFLLYTDIVRLLS